MKIVSYRYLWTLKDTPEGKVNIKIVTDTPEGLEQFETQLKALPDILKAGKEYVCSYEVDKLGLFEDIINI